MQYNVIVGGVGIIKTISDGTKFKDL